MHSALFCNVALLRLALPNFLSTLSVPLLGVVDIALAGHMKRVEDLASLALATILFQLIYWLFGFLRMGTTGSTAQSQSEGVISQQSIRILFNSGLLAISISIILISFQKPIFSLYYSLVSADLLTTNLAYSYSTIRILAAPATLLNFVIHGWYLGIQNAWAPLIFTIIIQLLNIVLNFYFVGSLGMGVEGLALATTLAQWIGFSMAIVHLIYKYQLYKFNFKPKLQELNKIIKNNTDLMLRTALLMLSIHSISWLATRLGTNELAASALILQLMGLLSYGLDGIAISCESLVGQAVGQKQRSKLWQIIRTGFLWCSILAILFTLAFWLGLDKILTLFTNKPYLINMCLEWKIYVVLSPLFCFWCYLWDGVYIGAMRTAAMRNSMIFSVVICYIPSILILVPKLEMHGLWISYLILMFARGVSLTYLAKREMKQAFAMDKALPT